MSNLDLLATVKEVEFDKKGRIIAMKGSCKARDVQPKANENIFKALGIDWVDC